MTDVLASAAQLGRPHYSDKSIKYVKQLLQQLARHGYVLVDNTPTRQYRSPYHYVLGPKGVDYLRGLGLDLPDSLRASKEVGKGYLHIQHSLELNDILISAMLLKATAPGYTLAAFSHERELARNPYQSSWRGDKHTLVPDAFLDFHQMVQDRKQRVPVLLEHDRGSEERRQFRRKIRSYIALLRSEAYKSHFNVKSVAIAFTTFKGEKRREEMRDWTAQELAETNEASIGLSFLFAAPTQPPDPKRLWLQPCWWTPYKQEQPMALLGGE